MPAWFPSPSQHFMFGALALLVYVLSTRARGERRAPTAAVSWVMGLALLPYVTLPLYLMFGQRKLKATPRLPAPVSDGDSHWATALLNSFGLVPPGPSHVRFHADGMQSREALWEIFDQARVQIDVCMFLIGDDALGHEALARLIQRARSGVQVRLLLDGLGAWSAPSRHIKALEEAGGHVAVFRPLLSMRRVGPRNLRNHRKLIIADDATLWAGGRNLAAEYFCGSGDEAPWTDLTFHLTGAVAAVAARQFEADWAAARGQQPRRICDPSNIAGGAPAQFLPSGPDQTEDTAQLLLMDACFRARHRLIAVTPYFVPDEGLRAAMRVAAKRGVRVTLVLPVKSNHPLTDFVRTRALRDLAQVGVEILLLPGMVHAKAVVVDDTLALCGSINLDLRSLLLNYEAAVVFYGAAEIAWLTQWIDTLGLQGKPFVSQPPGLLRDLAEGVLLTVAFQL